jgi:hypothetical protein
MHLGCSIFIEILVVREHHETTQQPTNSHLFSSGSISMIAVVVAVGVWQGMWLGCSGGVFFKWGAEIELKN